MTLAVVGLAGAMAALVTWRTALVRIAPQSASLFAAIGLPVNLRGLAFVNVATSSETQEEVKVLVIEGTIRNVSDRPVEVPRLRFAARDALGQEVYAWTALPARTSLGPNETMPFRTRLASPPAEGRDVLVRFFGPRDLLAQAQ